MTIAEMNRRKAELGYTNKMIAELSGVPLSTVQKVLSGTTAHPRRDTLMAMETVLSDPPFMTPEVHEILFGGRGEEEKGRRKPAFFTDIPEIVCESSPVYGAKTCGQGGPKADSDADLPEDAHIVGEAAVEYPAEHPKQQRKYTGPPDNPGDPVGDRPKQQGEYTLDDYYALPDDVRAELIDGVIYIMEAPSNIHQIISFRIGYILESYIESHNGGCTVLLAPADVQLDRDNRTMVEPDVMVICDRDKILRKLTYGAPDLVMEITSPSSRGKDMTLKLEKYRKAGVREYWVIEPDKKRIMVYQLREDMDIDLSIYGFEDEIPVGIFEGKCSIDFRKIYEKISFLY